MKKTKKSSLQWIYRTSGKSKKWVLLHTLICMMQASIAFIYANIMQNVIDAAAEGRGNDFLNMFLLFVGVVLMSWILLVLSRYLSDKSVAELEKSFRIHVFSQLLQRDYETVDGTHSGDWLTRIDSDTSVIVAAVSRIVPDFTGNILRLGFVLFFMLETIPIVIYIIIPLSVVFSVCSIFFRSKIKRLHQYVQEAMAKMRSTVQERLTSLGVIHAFTQEKNVVSQVEDELSTVVKTKMKRSIFVNMCNSSISLGLFAAQSIGIGLCCYNILHGNMSYGTMSAVLYLINQLERPLVSFSSYVSQAYAMLASADRLIEIEKMPYDTETIEIDKEEAKDFYENKLSSFGLKDAVFAYREDEEHTIVRELSLEVKKGEFVCFVGESGCGKSTTLKLLLNLYQMRSGSAYLTLNDGTQQNLHAGWRSLFAYVPQGNHLFSGTLRETLAFGDPELMNRDDQMWQALETACADGFVRELPDKLETVLGEKGSGLSEGQMQRIAIARAILSKRPILLLDECTSALDNETEYTLLKNLRSLDDRTVLAITHRKAALDFCDRQIEFYKNQQNS